MQIALHWVDGFLAVESSGRSCQRKGRAHRHAEMHPCAGVGVGIDDFAQNSEGPEVILVPRFAAFQKKHHRRSAFHQPSEERLISGIRLGKRPEFFRAAPRDEFPLC